MIPNSRTANILFLCTGNSCRSQMAEGFCRSYHHNITPYSAGTMKSSLNPYAVKVMNEIGIDMSTQFSKTVLELPRDLKFDIVYTLCNHANETCPIFSGAKTIHAGFDDPPTIAKSASGEVEILNIYRRVRDEIGKFVHSICV